MASSDCALPDIIYQTVQKICVFIGSLFKPMKTLLVHVATLKADRNLMVILVRFVYKGVQTAALGSQ